MRSTFLKCKIEPGQFNNEYAVSGCQANGKEFSLFAPDCFVEFEGTPSLDTPVEGWLQVRVVERKDGTVLVRLPMEAFEVGQYVTVQSE